MPPSPAYDLTVIIPAFNEALRLPATLKATAAFLATRPWSTQIIVMDDGSSDQTIAVAGEFMETIPHLRVIAQGENLGKGAAVKRGVSEADSRWLAFVDADLPYDLRGFDIALQHLDAGADIVIGGRDLPGSSVIVGYSLLRKVSGKVFALFAHALSLGGIPDTQCGFKFFKTAVAKQLFPRVTLKRFAFDIELLTIARRWQLKIVRIPVTLTHSHESSVRIVRDSAQMFWDLLLINHRRARSLYDSPAKEGEAQPCPGCGGDAPSFERGRDGWVVARCGGCRLLYLWNRLPESALADFYGRQYYQAGGTHGGYSDYEAQKADLLATARERLALLKRLAPDGRLLEVGCGSGYFLAAARESYAAVTGIDLSGDAIKVAREAGHDARCGELKDLPESDGAYDVLYAADLFEHLYRPHEFLKQAHARLRPGGILALVTPNEAGWLRRVSGKRWVSFKLPEHVAFYTPEYLAKMTQAAGFTPLHCRAVGQRVSVNFLLPRLKALSSVAGAVGALGLLPWRLTGTSLTAPTGNMLFIARKPAA